MGETVYVDLEVLAEVDADDYLVRVSKQDLNSLVSFNEKLVLRHWDGEMPVRLLSYGSNSVRTEGDANEGNNLTDLPRLPTFEIL